MLTLFTVVFLVFLTIGVFGYGDKATMPTYVEQEVMLNHSWFSPYQFILSYIVSQFLPGEFIIHVAVWIGFTIGFAHHSIVEGMGVAIAALLGLGLSGGVWGFLLHFLQLKQLKKEISSVIHHFLQLVSPGIIIAGAYMMVEAEEWSPSCAYIWTYAIRAFLFISTIIGIGLFRINAVLMLLLCGIAGWLLF